MHGRLPDLSQRNTIATIVTDNGFWKAKEETSDPIMMDNLHLNMHKTPYFFLQ